VLSRLLAEEALAADHRVQVLDRPRIGVLVIAITQHLWGWPAEAADESTCGNKDFTRHITRQIAGEICIDRGGELDGRGVQRGSHGHFVQHSAPMQVLDVRLVLGPVDKRVFAPGHTTLARTPRGFSSAAMAMVNPLTAPLPAG